MRIRATELPTVPKPMIATFNGLRAAELVFAGSSIDAVSAFNLVSKSYTAVPIACFTADLPFTERFVGRPLPFTRAPFFFLAEFGSGRAFAEKK